MDTFDVMVLVANAFLMMVVMWALVIAYLADRQRHLLHARARRDEREELLFLTHYLADFPNPPYGSPSLVKRREIELAHRMLAPEELEELRDHGYITVQARVGKRKGNWWRVTADNHAYSLGLGGWYQRGVWVPGVPKLDNMIAIKMALETDCRTVEDIACKGLVTPPRSSAWTMHRRDFQILYPEFFRKRA